MIVHSSMGCGLPMISQLTIIKLYDRMPGHVSCYHHLPRGYRDPPCRARAVPQATAALGADGGWRGGGRDRRRVSIGCPSGRWIDTDDAYVQADSMTMSTDVSGIVASIPVHEGQAVTKGEVLFTLDPQKFQIALDNARANLAQVRLNIESAKADYQAALARHRREAAAGERRPGDL